MLADGIAGGLGLVGEEFEVVEAVDLGGNGRQFFEDGQAARLAGVSREDRLDAQVFHQFAKFVGWEPAVFQLANRLTDGFGHGLGVLGADALANSVDAGVLLGQIVQVEINGEGADQFAEGSDIE